MPIDQWLAFVVASAVMLALPGPTVLLVVSYSLGYGRKAAFAVVAGVGLGGFTAMTASMLGLGAVLAASSIAFAVLRWTGAAYLVYLGVKLWRAPLRDRGLKNGSAPHIGSARVFAHAYAVTALNPKGIIFFVVFVPQFLVPAEPFWRQATTLIVSFSALEILNVTIFALLASSARGFLREGRAQLIVNRTSGSLLIGAGILTAGWRKASR